MKRVLSVCICFGLLNLAAEWVPGCFINSALVCADVPSTDITQPTDAIIGVPVDGSWPSNEAPQYAIDDNVNTKYLNFRGITEAAGFCVSPAESSAVVVGLTFTTANDAENRDPVQYELYGSNTSINGPYTLIASGDIIDFNQTNPWPRYTKNTTPVLFPNSVAYQHYKLVFPAVRNASGANSMQIAEVELIGEPEGGWPPEVDAGADQVLAQPQTRTQLVGSVEIYGAVTDPFQYQWTLTVAPNGVSIEDLVFEPNQYVINPSVRLPAVSGIYSLSLTASNSRHSVSDSVNLILSDSLCPVGDFNQDCRVDTEDLLILAQSWLDADVLSGRVPDLDGNDGVTLSDMAVLSETWGIHGPSAIISEFMALNTAKIPLQEGQIQDEDNDSSDWIELWNTTGITINLAGWYLTDDPLNLTQWEIPELTMESGAFALIFASGKDKRTPGEIYHTNFSLSSGSGFLALVEPDGKTVAHQYTYPAQYGNISYGLGSPTGLSTTTVDLILPGVEAYAKIPTVADAGTAWTASDYVPDGWKTGATGVGYDTQNDYKSLIGLDVKDVMYGKNASAYIRIPFWVEDLTGLQDLKLEMMYDDGFAAYLNTGDVVASANLPATLTWNSQASADHNDSLAVQYEPFVLSDDVLGRLRNGWNVLSIHGLNKGASTSDFLIVPKLTAVKTVGVSITSLLESYFQIPTPGSTNNPGQVNPGPQVRDLTRNPVPPLESENLVISAAVWATKNPVQQVDLIYCIGYGSEITLPMNDAGQGGDAVAGDSIYTATIPTTAYGAGDMIRWYVTASDTKNDQTREPAYLLAENSPRYYGTVVNDPSMQTNLPVFKYFLQSPSLEDTETGTRCSVFFLDQFYDNVLIKHRGGYTTSGRKIHFNDGYHFMFDPNYEQVDEINLNEQGADPTYLRPSLSFETYAAAGLPCSIVFPMHVIRNKTDLFVRVFVEQPDSHLLRRVGLDDHGAFYKVYSDLDTYPAGDEQVERKITRLNEDNSDLMTLRYGIAPDNTNRSIYLFDNINIPAVITYLAVCTLVHENDHTHKNYFLYRDTEGSGEWMFIPWDKDLTFGLNSGIGGIIADQDWPSDLDRSPSHPFFGSQRHQKVDYQWNRLFDAIYADPTSRQMYLRHLRTLMDTYLQAPGTPTAQLYYEKRINELANLMTYEGIGNLTTNLNAIRNSYLPVRRTHLYVNHLQGSTWPDDPAGIPDAQPAQVDLQIGDIDYNPVSWNQDEEYIQILNPNTFAADISGWTLSGGVSHTFTPGTVIPAGGALYLTPNAKAFRARTTSPSGGQHLFVQGGYKGHLSSWGETLEIRDTTQRLAASRTYVGTPSDAQRYLRITELMYHPADSTNPLYGDEDYEYIELTNIGTESLLLNGVKFTKGITYTFPDSLLIGPGQYLLLVKNQAAFTSRYTVPQEALVLSSYEGSLANSGETISLDDQTNSTILEITYDDKWYAITDGEGFSLVFSGDLNGLPAIWDYKTSWRASTLIAGSPGQAEQGLAADSIVFNEIMAHSHSSLPDWIELYNKTDQDINIGGWFLTDDSTDLNTIRKYEIPAGTIIHKNDYLVFYQDTSFGSVSLPIEKRFALSEAGETVYLYSGENGEVTGYYQARQKFDASETGIAFGRYEKASLSNGYDFVRMQIPTPLPPNTNSSPMITSLVITEIMYNPVQGADYEYLELNNRSAQAISLMTTVSTENPKGVFTSQDLPWQIDGIDFEFPAGMIIQPGEYIIVAKSPDLFNSAYGSSLPVGTRVFGPYTGKLNNSGEEIAIQMPGDQEYNQMRIYIPVETVDYSDAAPWPAGPNGTGQSLQRTDKNAYSNDPEIWTGAVPLPGK
ncbi:MAG: lamin tail domain-containing protein [Anaerohalosphaeraceae bacterium]